MIGAPIQPWKINRAGDFDDRPLPTAARRGVQWTSLDVLHLGQVDLCVQTGPGTFEWLNLSPPTNIYQRFAPLPSGDPDGSEDFANWQALLDDTRDAGVGGLIRGPATPVIAGYRLEDTLVTYTNITIEGAAAGLLGTSFTLADGKARSLFRLGAPADGSDPYWHRGLLKGVHLFGNKANQDAPAPVALSAIAIIDGHYIAEATTLGGALHGLRIGDVIELAGNTGDVWNVQTWVREVPSPTTFRFSQSVDNPPAAVELGTVARRVNLINAVQVAEVSDIDRVYGHDALHDGVWFGKDGTPGHLGIISMFTCGGAGVRSWSGRPLGIAELSGDNNGEGLLVLCGKASAGGTGLASTTIGMLKAEKHTVPVVKLNDYPGSLTINGGAIDMDPTNVGPCTQRTAKGSASSFHVVGLTMYPRTAGSTAVFEDLSTAAQSVDGGANPQEHSFDIGPNPRSATRFSAKRATPNDVEPIHIDASQGHYFSLELSASRTISAPTNPPGFQPIVQEITLSVHNTSGGPITVTWNAIYDLRRPFPDLAADERVLISFKWQGTAWRETARASNDLVRRASQTFTSSGSYTVPAGVTRVQISGSGGGSGGGGGGAANNSGGVSAQVGGGGGGAGAPRVQEFDVTAGTVITVLIGAGGTTGTAGAANGGSGGQGGGGGDTTAAGTGVAFTAKGATPGGKGGTGNSTTASAGGGCGSTGTTTTVNSSPGIGGPANTTGGVVGAGPGSVGGSGGGGGGPANAATAGGTGGGAGGLTSGGNPGGTAASGTVNGTAGGSAAANTGAGGGGGGGGSASGTGGTGGTGGSGWLTIRAVG